MDLDSPHSKNKTVKNEKSLKIENFIKYINIGLAILVIGLIGFYIYKNTSGNLNNKSQPNSDQKSASVTTPSPTTQPLYVDIAGAVKSPGVYQMQSDQRIIDILEKAGGFTEKADVNYIEKNLNKAEKLTDGEKIYIPQAGEIVVVASATPTVKSTVSKSTSSATTKPVGKVNINSSSRTDLISLPEIGEVTADKIISLRPYSTLDDLVTKGAMKKSSLDKIRDLITI